MAELGGIALEAAVGELLSVVLDVTKKAIKFKSILKDLESTLQKIEPVFAEIEKLNKVLDRPAQETEMFTDRLKKAQKLVYKCSKIRWWNYCKKPFYAQKLIDLDASILKFFQIEVQAQMSVDNKRILVTVKEIDAKLDGMRPGMMKGSDLGVFVGPCGVPGIRDHIFGFDVHLQELKRRLLRDGVQVVVLSAPGGCGKTTLAKMLCHDVEIKGIFRENIFFVTVSKTPNLRVFVQNMFRHKSFSVPEFQNDDDALNQLEILLLKQIGPDPVLLVMDDVWSGSESLIQKFMFRIPGYKILVTSRSEFPRFDSTYKLELLDDQDAMALFCHSAFPQGESVNMPDDLVHEIVTGCGGFPLALSVVGGSLCRQPEVIWRRTLKQWSEGQSIFDSNTDLFIRLKTSIDALDEKDNVKECFLDLGSFPEDQRIPVTALMDMWMELYNLDEDGVCALANIHELSSRNLVNLVFTRKDSSDIDGYYNEHFVTQHDLLRELAIHQSSQKRIEQRKRLIMEMRGNDLPKWSTEQIQPFHACLLSISTECWLQMKHSPQAGIACNYLKLKL
ncbi:probable disease resistance protein At5g66900 isoform X2 [Cornus florida]|uniref:probable disease resistance protein At5g66900 isoform X2 n=1 Tax=Cornus florida TaxID=4283 RepID=UPI00289E364A|nr:probable disease resistance protein At5g66900 isoform X2 [Cornus florida]